MTMARRRLIAAALLALAAALSPRASAVDSTLLNPPRRAYKDELVRPMMPVPGGSGLRAIMFGRNPAVPENWLDLANDARRAANQLATEDHFRSCVARAYYAAYSKVTHELVVAAALPLPPDREGFGHRRTREVILTSMPNMRQDRRDKLSELVGRLYTLRIDADYKPSTVVENREAREALSLMKTIFESF